jgi:hypothetical protein
VDINKILEKLSFGNTPVGLGGCRNSTHSFECCEYNITVFDKKKDSPEILEYDDEIVIINHASFDETSSNVLIQFDKMQIISDEQWELRMFLSKIDAKRERIFKDFAKNCLIDATFCTTKAKDRLKTSDPFASVWVKCSALFIADAISSINNQRPSPTHMLQYVRDFEKNRLNENFTSVNNCLGIERATPSLLSRMCKSTIGFSEMINEKNFSKIIQKKHDYLVNDSLFSDCYFYLLYINRNNVIQIKNGLHKKPELIHVLKVAFDLDHNLSQTEIQTNLLHKVANELIMKI